MNNGSLIFNTINKIASTMLIDYRKAQKIVEDEFAKSINKIQDINLFETVFIVLDKVMDTDAKDMHIVLDDLAERVSQFQSFNKKINPLLP
jgi:hypothetical protein